MASPLCTPIGWRRHPCNAEDQARPWGGYNLPFGRGYWKLEGLGRGRKDGHAHGDCPECLPLSPSEPWTMGFSKSNNRKFFYNKKTQKSVYALPTESIAPFQ